MTPSSSDEDGSNSSLLPLPAQPQSPNPSTRFPEAQSEAFAFLHELGSGHEGDNAGNDVGSDGSDGSEGDDGRGRVCDREVRVDKDGVQTDEDNGSKEATVTAEQQQQQQPLREREEESTQAPGEQHPGSLLEPDTEYETAFIDAMLRIRAFREVDHVAHERFQLRARKRRRSTLSQAQAAALAQPRDSDGQQPKSSSEHTLELIECVPQGSRPARLPECERPSAEHGPPVRLPGGRGFDAPTEQFLKLGCATAGAGASGDRKVLHALLLEEYALELMAAEIGGMRGREIREPHEALSTLEGVAGLVPKQSARAKRRCGQARESSSKRKRVALGESNEGKDENEFDSGGNSSSSVFSVDEREVEGEDEEAGESGGNVKEEGERQADEDDDDRTRENDEDVEDRVGDVVQAQDDDSDGGGGGGDDDDDDDDDQEDSHLQEGHMQDQGTESNGSYRDNEGIGGIGDGDDVGYDEENDSELEVSEEE